jgi:hypothetical protein
MDDAIVNDIADELRKLITSKNSPVDLVPSENQIILAAKNSDRTLTIICDDQAHFHLKESQLRNGTQGQVYGEQGRDSPHGRPYTRNEMLARVEQWLGRQR